MAVTVTLAPDPSTASVLITVTSTGGNASLFTLTRSDSNGVAAVRLLAGQSISSGTLIVRDSEPALAGTIAYTASYSGGESSTSTTVLNVSGVVLNLPVLPQSYSLVGDVQYEADRGTRSTIHRPINRPDPVVVLSRMQTRNGRLVYLAQNRTAADEITGIYDRQEVALVRFDNQMTGDLYHVAESVSSRVAIEGGRAWEVEIRYVEVARPSAPLAGALGWNFASVANHGTFLAVRDSFATFADLTAGNKK